MHSVASFFVSRVDAETDSRLEAIGGDNALALRGKLAIANAKLAYEDYKHVFSGPRWKLLAAKGATKQRCLWASTSTKIRSTRCPRRRSEPSRSYCPTSHGLESFYDDVVNTVEREAVEKFTQSSAQLLESTEEKRLKIAV